MSDDKVTAAVEAAIGGAVAATARVRVGLAIYLDVDPACLGFVLANARGATVDASGLTLRADNPGDVAFIGGALAREVLTILGAGSGARVLPFGATLATGECALLSSRKVGGLT
jgi:hypothetical protein